MRLVNLLRQGVVRGNPTGCKPIPYLYGWIMVLVAKARTVSPPEAFRLVRFTIGAPLIGKCFEVEPE